MIDRKVSCTIIAIWFLLQVILILNILVDPITDDEDSYIIALKINLNIIGALNALMGVIVAAHLLKRKKLELQLLKFIIISIAIFITCIIIGLGIFILSPKWYEHTLLLFLSLIDIILMLCYEMFYCYIGDRIAESFREVDYVYTLILNDSNR